ncbi:MAG: hypothetical protein ACK5LJ_02835 [Paracoccus sp. (in: a-proteobacteria)]
MRAALIALALSGTSLLAACAPPVIYPLIPDVIEVPDYDKPIMGEMDIALTLADGRQEHLRLTRFRLRVESADATCKRIDYFLAAEASPPGGQVEYDMFLRLAEGDDGPLRSVEVNQYGAAKKTSSGFSTTFASAAGGENQPATGHFRRNGGVWHADLSWSFAPDRDRLVFFEIESGTVNKGKQRRKPLWLDPATGNHGATITYADIRLKMDIPALRHDWDAGGYVPCP